jgi:NADH-quinone oxidoreductase subunit N
VDLPSNCKTEFTVLTFGVTVGALVVCSATNLLTLYVGIETMSILSYVLASLKKNDVESAEAGLKYALYGAIAAGIMLFGLGHIYGLVGSLQYSDLAVKVATLSGGQLVLLKSLLVLIFVGIGFKISAFPFHMWSPDVYQGSPIPTTTFFSMVPKIAAIAALVRFTFALSANTEIAIWWTHFLQITAILTMTVGNLSALEQTSVKRMLAFSSISHVGFLLLGVSINSPEASSITLLYTLLYVFMTIVSFYIVDQIITKYGSDQNYFFKGLIDKHPFMAIAMTIAMFSLAGLPPFSGFIAKFNILSLVIKSGSYTVAVFAGLNSVISLFYYLKLAKIMIVEKAEDKESVGFSFLKQSYIAIVCVPIVIFGIYWETLYNIFSYTELFKLK